MATTMNAQFTDFDATFDLQHADIVAADIDNDGDLDIITNNLNSKASIYSNQTNSKANYLKVKLQFEGKNSFGILCACQKPASHQFTSKHLFNGTPQVGCAGSAP